jgi:membrane fusion protein (multidrug efflux system)
MQRLAEGTGKADGTKGFGGGRLLTLSCLLAGLQLVAGCNSGTEGQAGAPVVAQVQPVTLHRVGDGRLVDRTTASGTVRLRRETPLAFLSDGRVRSVSVREGDRVQGGQLLATLDRTAIDAQARSAASRLQQADAELQRQRELLAKGWVAKSRVEAAEAAAESARAELSGARFTQRFATIVAPTPGVILSRTAEPGQTLSAGTPVLLLGEFASGFVVRVPLSAGRVRALRVGDTADVGFRDRAAPPMVGRIIEIAGRAEPSTGTFQVELALPADPALRSGLIADVSFAGAQSAAGLGIPATALFSARADEGFVWVVDPGTRKVQARMVRLGRVTSDGVEIVSGLARGDLIVAAGVDRLSQGEQVKPVQTRAG